MLEKYRGGSDPFSGTALAVRCYESHPLLKFGKGRLYGGSASHPMVKDADIYVSLQSGSTSGKISDPWDPPKVIEVQYSINDMQAPSNVARFKKMVTWLCTQLQEGKTIHVGCIGGHGRTGTVLSAIVAELLEKQDAIQWVRKHYCKKAVESKEQIKFLMKHYGVSEAEATKGTTSGWKTTTFGTGSSGWSPEPKQGTFLKERKDPVASPVVHLVPDGVTVQTKSFAPMASARSLWKPKKKVS